MDNNTNTVTGNKLILFTNSYPYGSGETFLHDEIPFLAKRFKEIIIYPLYLPQADQTVRRFPENITVKKPLLPFDHKDKKRLFFKGLFNMAPIGFAVKEFFSRGVFLSPKKIWIFFNYLFILRSILSNKTAIREIISGNAPVLYFYWGDKSALIIPFIKKRINRLSRKILSPVPQFVVRFHGSDIYEEAKGYLPFRNRLYKQIDYAVPISGNGAGYIRSNYKKSLPAHIVVHRLGSYNPRPESLPSKDKVFRILSCSNVIELKRLHLIADALKELGKELNLILELTERNIHAIQWTHIGGGPLMEELKTRCNEFTPFIQTDFKGYMPHDEVIGFYRDHRIDLFIQVSRSEGIPVSIMEAISFGAPVIATNVGGVSEILNENTGTLLPKDLTVKQLKETIIKYLNMSDEEHTVLRITALNEWKANWNIEKNYSVFAGFLKELATSNLPADTTHTLG